MSDFINTIDALGDDAVMDSIIDRTITEFKDDQLTTVNSYAFYGCTALETVDLPNVTSVGNYAFDKAGSTTDGLELNLPNLTTMSYGGLAGAYVTTLYLPKISQIPLQAFSGCKVLTKAVLPICSNINNNSFGGCSKLEWLDIKGGGAFNGNSFANTLSQVLNKMIYKQGRQR